MSPARLQQVEDRLALVERLKRKYGPTLAQVLATHAALRTEVATLADATSGLGALTRAVEENADAYRTAAAALSEARHRAAGAFAAAAFSGFSLICFAFFPLAGIGGPHNWIKKPAYNPSASGRNHYSSKEQRLILPKAMM